MDRGGKEIEGGKVEVSGGGSREEYGRRGECIVRMRREIEIRRESHTRRWPHKSSIEME